MRREVAADTGRSHKLDSHRAGFDVSSNIAADVDAATECREIPPDGSTHGGFGRKQCRIPIHTRLVAHTRGLSEPEDVFHDVAASLNALCEPDHVAFDVARNFDVLREPDDVAFDHTANIDTSSEGDHISIDNTFDVDRLSERNQRVVDGFFGAHRQLRRAAAHIEGVARRFENRHQHHNSKHHACANGPAEDLDDAENNQRTQSH